MGLGVLDRSRTIAPEGWSRWLVPPSALAVHLSIGQEAAAVGACWPLAPTDVITSTHRGHGHCLAKGLAPLGMFAELMGKVLARLVPVTSTISRQNRSGAARQFEKLGFHETGASGVQEALRSERLVPQRVKVAANG